MDQKEVRNFRDILVWNKCSQVWTKEYGFNRRLLLATDIKTEDILKVREAFKNEKGDPDDLWVDQITGLIFSSSQNYFNWPHEFSFLDEKSNFLKNPLTGLHFIRKQYSYLFNRGFLHNTELVTDLDIEEASKYEGSSILILGAGPTLKERLSQVDLSQYDYIWSCTKFFLNPDIKEINLDLFSIGGNVSLEDPDLAEYMNSNPDTKYGIEAFVQPFKTPDELVKFRDTHGADRGFTFHTRYFSKLGAGPRLLALAAILEAAEIHFLGIDGHPLGHQHSFEKDKHYNTIKEDGVEEAPTRQGAEHAYRRQFCLLWNYLFTFPNTHYVNLGQGHEGNQSTDVFKNYNNRREGWTD